MLWSENLRLKVQHTNKHTTEYKRTPYLFYYFFYWIWAVIWFKRTPYFFGTWEFCRIWKLKYGLRSFFKWPLYIHNHILPNFGNTWKNGFSLCPPLSLSVCVHVCCLSIPLSLSLSLSLCVFLCVSIYVSLSLCVSLSLSLSDCLS